MGLTECAGNVIKKCQTRKRRITIAKQKNYTSAGCARNAVMCGRYGLTVARIVTSRNMI